MKAGYKTSELWLSVLMAVVGISVVTGVLTPGQAGEIKDATVKLAEAVSGLVMAVAPVVAYIWSRAKVKSSE
jgi:hypothetical protein